MKMKLLNVRRWASSLQRMVRRITAAITSILLSILNSNADGRSKTKTRPETTATNRLLTSMGTERPDALPNRKVHRRAQTDPKQKQQSHRPLAETSQSARTPGRHHQRHGESEAPGPSDEGAVAAHPQGYSLGQLLCGVPSLPRNTGFESCPWLVAKGCAPYSPNEKAQR